MHLDEQNSRTACTETGAILSLILSTGPVQPFSVLLLFVHVMVLSMAPHAWLDAIARVPDYKNGVILSYTKQHLLIAHGFQGEVLFDAASKSASAVAAEYAQVTAATWSSKGMLAVIRSKHAAAGASPSDEPSTSASSPLGSNLTHIRLTYMAPALRVSMQRVSRWPDAVCAQA